MDTTRRITQIKEERGWSKYKIAMESGLSQDTVSKLFTIEYDPTVTTLESLCKGFDMTLSEFFIDDTSDDLEKNLYDEISKLTLEQKFSLYRFLKSNT